MSALPAEPILASALYHLNASESTAAKVLTGCRTIDAILAPGLGGVVCISAEDDAGGTELANTVLVTHLLDSSAAAIIDPIGFNLQLFYDLLRSRCPSNEAATGHLDSLSISRVFTIEGLLSSLSDIQRQTTEDSSPRLLLIPLLDTLLLPLHRSRPSHAAALTTALLRSLRHLTKSNWTVLLSASTTPAQGRRDAGIFASCTSRPSFEALLGRADVHLFLHRVPRSAEDARRAYGDDARSQAHTGVVNGTSAPTTRTGGKVTWVSCLEVLRDIHSGRRGRFAFFTTHNGGIRDM